MYPLLLTIVVLQIIDTLTTLAVLSRGGVEMNPIMAKFQAALGTLLGTALPKVAAVVVLLSVPPLPEWALGVIIGVYVAVCANNIRVLYRLNGKRRVPSEVG